MKRIVFIIIVISSAFIKSHVQQDDLPVLKGPYLGQTPPGNQSILFAGGFVSTESGELNSVFTPDGKEFYFTRRGISGKRPMIMVSRMINDGWTKPGPVDFSGTYSDIDLFISPDGKSMVFCSTRPSQIEREEKRQHDFWISEREGDNWGTPVVFAKEAASEFEDFFPIVAESGNLYFNSQRGGLGTNDIFCSRFLDGRYWPAKKLPGPVNTEFREFDAYVSQDESLIIFSSERPGGYGRSDIYVSFRKPDGNWTEPVNPGNKINSPGSEYGATVSPDRKYFFFTSNKNGTEDIFWISIKIIEELKPEK